MIVASAALTQGGASGNVAAVVEAQMFEVGGKYELTIEDGEYHVFRRVTVLEWQHPLLKFEEHLDSSTKIEVLNLSNPLFISATELDS